MPQTCHKAGTEIDNGANLQTFGGEWGETIDDEVSSPDLYVAGRDRSDAFGLAKLRARPRRPTRACGRRFLPARPRMAEAGGALPHHRGAGHHDHLDRRASPLPDPPPP